MDEVFAGILEALVAFLEALSWLLALSGPPASLALCSLAVTPGWPTAPSDVL